jgi:AcrR family transcriptional regulator
MAVNKQTTTAGRGRRRASAALRARAREVYRDAILDAAARVFVRRGFAGTRMSDVAAEAGLATGTLYNYFPNRDELLASLVERVTQELMSEVSGAGEAAAEAPLRTQLEQMVRAAFEHFDQHRVLFAVFAEAGSISPKPREIAARQCLHAQRDYHCLFEGALSRGVETGVIRCDVPIRILLGYLIGSLQGVVREWSGLEDPSPLADQAPMVVDLFLRGASSSS